MQIRANIDISLYCLFQRLVFSERREMLVTDGQTPRLQYASVGGALGIITLQRRYDTGTSMIQLSYIIL